MRCRPITPPLVDAKDDGGTLGAEPLALGVGQSLVERYLPVLHRRADGDEQE
jgi:hypothetical protein